MRLYEIVFIGRQDLSQQQIEALGGSLGIFVTQNGGEVIRSEYCGFRNLAYPIKKNRKGHYYVIQMRGGGPLVAEFSRMMRINEDIIRLLVVCVEKFSDGDNLISQAKTFDSEFPGKDFGNRSSGARASSVVQNAAEDGVEEAQG
ncbi:MAG: 30S ribosomal protein S6 [Holosporaceae bacterium]|jgi:small subunit ribosomal protein S6|nr:30S ribosomal protein S6 [Holosporaceae bacterium]